VDFEAVKDSHRFESLKLEKRGITSQTLKQGNLWQKESLWRDSMVARLIEAGRPELAQTLNGCHRERSVRVCNGCRSARMFWNRCELKHCPLCAQRLARERRELLEEWTKKLQQPKHVVLTARNTSAVTKEYLTFIKKAFARLRRTRFAANWLGGFYSIECTWSVQDGAHVHIHALIESRWIDSGELARTWGKCVGQDFAVVKVKDCRDASYLQEVSKYVAKGSELASWSGQMLAQFIDAIQNTRMFGVFGNLYGMRTEMREFLDSLQSARNVCECGCREFRILNEEEWQWSEIEHEIAIAPRPPPLTEPKSHDPLLPGLS